MIAKEDIDLTEFLVKETGMSKSKIKSLYKHLKGA